MGFGFWLFDNDCVFLDSHQCNCANTIISEYFSPTFIPYRYPMQNIIRKKRV